MFAIMTNAKIITICSLDRFATFAALTTYLESTRFLNKASQIQRLTEVVCSGQGRCAAASPREVCVDITLC